MFVLLRLLQKSGKAHITREDIEDAKKVWIKTVQHDCFGEEISCLLKVTVPKSSVLHPFLQILKEGLNVLRRRIENAKIPKVVKRHPILYPCHPYTKLYVEWKHASAGSYGQERVVHQIRQHFWILKCRQAVRRCAVKCTFCKIRRANPEIPMMGQLPVERVVKSFPFDNAAVD